MTPWAIVLLSSMVGQLTLGVVALANMGTPDGWSVAIGQFGIASVLGFLLVKLEPRLKAIEDANIILAKAQLLLVASLRLADEVHREQARHELRAINRKYPPPAKEPDGS